MSDGGKRPPAEEGVAWSETTRDRWFYLALALSTAALGYLFSPFLTVLLFAGVVVVVTWPVFVRIRNGVRGRNALAAVLTTLLLAVVVFGPLGVIGYLFVVEAVAAVQSGVEFVKSGQIQVIFGQLAAYEHYLPAEITDRLLPEDFDLAEAVAQPIQQGLLSSLNALGTWIPGAVTTTFNVSIDLIIFVFAVISLYMEGPRVLDVARRLSPIEDRYEARLFEVFREFSNNLVVGSLATGTLQGVVAGIGFAIAGVDRVIFLAILTAVFSFVPLIGTALVWVPVSLGLLLGGEPGWAAFVAIWSALLTGGVDNLVRPFFLRGSSNIHPLLIFLAVFGGLSWMGFPGVLVGPVLVAFFLALYTIYVRDFLDEPVEHVPVPEALGEEPAQPEAGSAAEPSPGADQSSSSSEV